MEFVCSILIAAAFASVSTSGDSHCADIKAAAKPVVDAFYSAVNQCLAGIEDYFKKIECDELITNEADFISKLKAVLTSLNVTDDEINEQLHPSTSNLGYQTKCLYESFTDYSAFVAATELKLLPNPD